MTHQDTIKAIEIITKSNSVNVSFNVPVEDNYSNTHSILIHRCNANLIKLLIEDGFSLFMSDKGLSVDKF
jgi:hypothetical protein